MSKLFRRSDSDVWYVRVPRPGGGTRKLSTGCTTKRAAEARLPELEREAVDSAYAASKTTVQKILDDYYRSRVRLGRAKGSLHHVRVKSGHLLRLLPRLARDVTHQVLTQYVDRRAEEGVKSTTWCKELRVFGGAWKLARRNKLVAAPLDEIMPELHDDYSPGERALSPWELVALSTVLAPHRMAVVAFAVAAGCDPGAIARVRREDVAPDFGSVLVRGTKRKSRYRTVPLELPAQRLLVRWAVARADGARPLLFGPWLNVRRDLHLACSKVGIPGCSPNDLRRTFGRWLRAERVSPNLIGAAMGHADSRMVERVYGKLAPDELSAAIAGSLMGRAPVASRDLPALPAHDDAANPAENWCAGRESNPRHGDFQSTHPNSDDPPVIAAYCDVTGSTEKASWDANGMSACLVRRAHAALHGDFDGRVLGVDA